ncbi:MAG: zinc transporter ZupT [Planctomycetes bacterium]|nr:zinc transporter ZupT [Planctomycetota bacterium]
MSGVWLALGLTVFAGMATGIGSIIAFFARRSNYRFLSVATGFSAGVMLYVSFVEIFGKGIEALTKAYGSYWGHWANAGSFFGGIALIGLIDTLIPSTENPHETHPEEEKEFVRQGVLEPPQTAETIEEGGKLAKGIHIHAAGERKLMRMGLFTALAIGIHNFPEGLATFLAALEDPAVGAAIAIAVALHNIPEGISVSVPIFYATGDRKKAFIYSALSGLSEPIGAAIAYIALRFTVGDARGAIPPEIMGALFGAVAGIMVYISLDELLPTSRAYGKGHDSLIGLIAGMVVMAVSLLIMK